MPAQLTALSEGPNILLDKPILLLGRHPECDIQLNSRKISRRHCCIAQVHDFILVRDLGSTNGIRINGERMLEGKLHSGDELTIGNFIYQVATDGVANGVAPLARDRDRDRDRDRVRKPSVNDSMLEKAEEPIPLEESVSLAKYPAAKPAAVSAPLGAPLSQRPVPPPTIKDSQPSFFIPDQLSLMPPSGTFPKPNQPEGNR